MVILFGFVSLHLMVLHKSSKQFEEAVNVSWAMIDYKYSD